MAWATLGLGILTVASLVINAYVQSWSMVALNCGTLGMLLVAESFRQRAERNRAWRAGFEKQDPSTVRGL